MDEAPVVSKLLLDCVDFMRYVDPDLFDLGPLTHYFLRDDEEEELYLKRLPYSCLQWLRFSAKLQR